MKFHHLRQVNWCRRKFMVKKSQTQGEIIGKVTQWSTLEIISKSCTFFFLAWIVGVCLSFASLNFTFFFSFFFFLCQCNSNYPMQCVTGSWNVGPPSFICQDSRVSGSCKRRLLHLDCMWRQIWVWGEKKKESKETIPVNIYWRFLNRTWLVLMCACFYLLWGDKIKEWSVLMKRFLLPPFFTQSQRWNGKIILPRTLFKLSTSWIYSLAWIQDSSMMTWLRIWQHAWFLTCGENY